MVSFQMVHNKKLKKTKNLVDKATTPRFINNADLDENEAATLATEAELKGEQDRITTLQALDSSYFRGKSHFEENGNHGYLVYGNYIYLRKCFIQWRY